MAAMLAVLLAIHFVCNIVAAETPGVNNDSPLVFQVSIPEGYVPYPQVNAAYKFVNERVSRQVARERCARDNAHLAVIDSYLKVRLIRMGMPTNDPTHVGIYRRLESEEWMSAITGLPLSSIPWAPDEPNGSGTCLQIYAFGNGLGRFSCSAEGNYVCEIPI